MCISGSVHDQIRINLSLSFHSLGEKSFKNIQQPVRTFSVSEFEAGEPVPDAPSAPPVGGPATAQSPAKWIAAALVLLLAGGGYWAYTTHERSKEDQAHSMIAGSQPAVTPPAAALPSAAATSVAAPPASAPPAIDQPPKSAGKTDNPASGKPSPAAQAKPTPAAAAPKKAPASQVAAAAQPPTVPPATPTPSAASPSAAPDATVKPPAAAPGATAANMEGSYAGPVCFAATLVEPERCHRGEAAISGAKITGKWTFGLNGELTMFLDGDVTPAGELKIEMRSFKPDGSRLSIIDLTGNVRGGYVIANGKFLNGRGATITWHKKPPVAK
jgi:hypothetical protein